MTHTKEQLVTAVMFEAMRREELADLCQDDTLRISGHDQADKLCEAAALLERMRPW